MRQTHSFLQIILQRQELSLPAMFISTLASYGVPSPNLAREQAPSAPAPVPRGQFGHPGLRSIIPCTDSHDPNIMCFMQGCCTCRRLSSSLLHRPSYGVPTPNVAREQAPSAPASMPRGQFGHPGLGAVTRRGTLGAAGPPGTEAEQDALQLLQHRRARQGQGRAPPR